MPHSARFVAALLAIGVAAAVASLAVQKVQMTGERRTDAAFAVGGDTAAGRRAFLRNHCDACHETDPAVMAAGKVGPSLSGLSQRAVIAGRLPNQPDVLVAWIAHPQRLEPGSAMPEQGLSDRDARDIAAWLLSRK